MKKVIQMIADFLNLEIISFKTYSLHIADVMYVTLILIGAKILLMLLKKWFKKISRRQETASGRYYAIYQILSYILWIIAIVLVLDGLGIKVTILLAGSAALLVGIGLGIQQTFHDVFSGIILLIDRTIQVDDVVEVDGMVATVQEIGLRASKVVTRNDIVVLVPNSKFTSENVINWSHSKRQARFNVSVGVAYDSDVDLVKNCLLTIVKSDTRVVEKPAPFVRIESFDDSAIVFAVYFWSNEVFRIENLRSDIRFQIVKQFRELQISIPFPQRDLNVKNLPLGLLNSKMN
ncbi:MAG: mechanosensitive ion channel family protein [Flavobacteriales bacterium]